MSFDRVGGARSRMPAVETPDRRIGAESNHIRIQTFLLRSAFEMNKFALVAAVLSLSVFASSQASALSHGSGSKFFFQREANKQERAASQPQVDRSPAQDAPAAPKAHKHHKRRS